MPNDRASHLAVGAGSPMGDSAGGGIQGVEALEDLARLRAIFNMAVDAIITIDERGIVESANPATERLFGYAAGELIGQNVSTLMPEPYRREHDGYLANYLRTGVATIIGIGREVTGMRRDGTLFPVSLAVSEVRVGKRRMFSGILRDLTERRRLEREVLLAAINEQRRIGHELHDGVCQDLAGLSMSLGLLARRLAKTDSSEIENVRKLDDMVREIADQARKLAHGLNPIDVEAGGLAGALELLVTKVSQSSGVRCHFHWDGRAQAPDDSAATHVYRIAQEALGNSIQHGKPSRVDVHLFLSDDRVILRLEDDGAGLGKSTSSPRAQGQKGAVPVEGRSPGIGLHTMNYRARMIGGTFEIHPRPRGGTVVICSIRHDAGHSSQSGSFKAQRK